MTSVDAFGFYADWRCVGYPWTTGLSHCCRRRGSCADTARSLILLVTVCRQQSATDRGSGEENCRKGWVHPTLWAWPGLDRPGSSRVQSVNIMSCWYVSLNIGVHQKHERLVPWITSGLALIRTVSLWPYPWESHQHMRLLCSSTGVYCGSAATVGWEALRALRSSAPKD